MHLNAALTLAVFVAVLVVMITRPRGINEAWPAAVGATAMLLLGLETWRQAWSTVAQGMDVLAFLLALMLLSSLLELSGLFDWAAVRAAHMAGGNGRALYRNIYCLGAVTTILLSLDTTAIILTPIVIACVKRLELKSRGILLACAFVANTGSLLLPVSNLTNLLFQSRYHFTFWQFSSRMLLPQIIALSVNYIVLIWLCRDYLPGDYDVDRLPQASDVLQDKPLFYAAIGTVAGLLVGYFAASAFGVPAYIVAILGVLVLLTVAKVRKRLDLRAVTSGISWQLFVFVIGLFIVVRGVENLHIAQFAAKMLLDSAHLPLLSTLTAAFGAGLGSNIVNNIPMALIALSVLGHTNVANPAVYAALVGCNLGPNLTVIGSIATMLVITSARMRGEEIGGKDFLRVGILVAPLTILAASLTLYLEFRF